MARHDEWAGMSRNGNPRRNQDLAVGEWATHETRPGSLSRLPFNLAIQPVQMLILTVSSS